VTPFEGIGGGDGHVSPYQMPTAFSQRYPAASWRLACPGTVPSGTRKFTLVPVGGARIPAGVEDIARVPIYQNLYRVS
jgi:hypothetical protein